MSPARRRACVEHVVREFGVSERPNHVWAHDFVEDQTREGRKFRMLRGVDEFTREALAIRVARKLSSSDVIDVLATCSSGAWCQSHPIGPGAGVRG